MKLENFIKKNYKDIWLEYEAYLRKGKLPKIGAIVKTKSGGYCSSGSVTLEVKGHCKKGEISNYNKNFPDAVWGGDYIILTNGREEFLVEQKDWWKELRITKE